LIKIDVFGPKFWLDTSTFVDNFSFIFRTEGVHGKHN
jgi:hypothetical protein